MRDCRSPHAKQTGHRPDTEPSEAAAQREAATFFPQSQRDDRFLAQRFNAGNQRPPTHPQSRRDDRTLAPRFNVGRTYWLSITVVPSGFAARSNASMAALIQGWSASSSSPMLCHRSAASSTAGSSRGSPNSSAAVK
ncbi:MAG: hypothetical protein K0Q72_930 [Armatimonadetes bacterium]|nr:hypothetical protein [Armatimonadota bacterium]